MRMIASTPCIGVYGLDGAAILQRQLAALQSHFQATTITVIITIERLPSVTNKGSANPLLSSQL